MLQFEVLAGKARLIFYKRFNERVEIIVSCKIIGRACFIPCRKVYTLVNNNLSPAFDDDKKLEEKIF